MLNTKNIEVEGGEIAIKNSEGGVAIIPRNKVSYVKAALEDGCDSCIDRLVNSLPKDSDYAEDGTFIGNPPPKQIPSPIYEDLNDFRFRNRKATTFIKNKDTDKFEQVPFFIADSNGEYLTNTSLYYNYGSDKEQCMGRANRAVDACVPGTSYLEESNRTKGSLGVSFSTPGRPTDEQMERYIHFTPEKDNNFGSFDSWDLLPAYRKNSPDNIIFDSFGKKSIKFGEFSTDSYGSSPITVEDYLRDYKGKIPIGSYIIWGDNHTTRLIGYTKDGYDIIADYGEIKVLDENFRTYYNDITAIASIPGKEKYTYGFFDDRNKKANEPNTTPYLNNLENLPTEKDGETVSAGEDFVRFHDILYKDKNYLSIAGNIDPEMYDRYAKIATTIAGAETEYGSGIVYNLTDFLGSSIGPTQLIPENVSEKYKDTLSYYEKDSPEYMAAATILYLKELDRYKDNWMKHGDKEQEKPYVMQDLDIKDKAVDTARSLQGKKRSGYIHQSGLSRDIFRVDGAEYSLPYKQVWQSDEDYTEEVNEYFKEKGREDLRFGFNEEGKRTIYKKTQGNTIPNEIEDIAFYAWQSPSTIYYGDAQGESEYYKKNKNIYKKLYNNKKYVVSDN